MPKVLIADKMSPRAAEIFRERGVEVDVKTGLSQSELIKIIAEYDGLAIRSSTKVTSEILAAAHQLKVVGRAGIGVDNVDIPAASAQGVVVMNTPFGNSITTAEHAIALICALARQIPQADRSTQAGKWEKSKFMGVELTGKSLGLIGCGNIGSIVANRARGLQMKVLAYDPFLSSERAKDLGVEKTELASLLERADFVSLHTPLTDATRNIIDKEALAKMKKNARLVNCARGGLVDEDALYEALENGQLAGAALDVYAEEPARENRLFGHEKVICTPHLGASTREAQENVALQIAEQISDYLCQGTIANALNVPSVSAQDAPKLRPYLELADLLGSFAGQITETGLIKVHVEYQGELSKLNTKPLTATVLAGLLRPLLDHVNTVSAPLIAKERNISVSETAQEQTQDFHSLMRLTVVTEQRERSVAGSLFGGARPRLIAVEDIPLEAELHPHMLFVRNQDKPGMIGALGTLLSESGINIANFQLGRKAKSGHALALIGIDQEIEPALVKRVESIDGVDQVVALHFPSIENT